MQLEIKYSTEKDASVYVNYVYKFKGYEHGRENVNNNLLKKLDPGMQKIITSAENEEEVYEKVLKYLTNSYEKNKDNYEKSIMQFQTEWGEVGANVIKFLEFLYQKPFPFEKVTAYLTTNYIFPYNYNERYFYASIRYLLNQLQTTKHELNHFMFYHYYPELRETLGEEKYELLKESLSFFSNPTQKGKPNEAPLRDLYRSKIWKNMDEAISEGKELLLSR